ncbi:hypothetical protein SPRG_13460 [Saprolegnia parasitica CBS 223.65]|uniref:COMM domain-containing protein n=1 Tax=Saprolegnia parasitica (strain CBS 223.65) TaxID=695850 RepID=A0A067C0Z6_SAPPC|nr:hypothetical protein SPRG_13460 [Saprolegnia parasitica CBS 223.65]KDO20206.1 hypothetical protein SPRG_13460 [Saprolegnia parasitica CBS 223.65]|eukprot:XP_012209093.1 hypothetical protein SPRG_13460 [Saprolegnia parasitica CBS 223.65]
MKFRFCGDQEPPSWLLAEIPVVAQASQGAVDLCELTRLLAFAVMDKGSFDDAMALLMPTVTKFDSQAIIVALKWILLHATKYNVEEVALATELQQLGFAADLAKAFASVYNEQHGALRRHLAATNMKLGRAYSRLEAHVDVVLGSRHAKNLKTAHVILTMHAATPTTFAVDATTFRSLHHELRHARKLMDVGFN